MLALECVTVIAADMALLAAYHTGLDIELHDCLMESEAILNSLQHRSQAVLRCNRDLTVAMTQLEKHVRFIKNY